MRLQPHLTPTRPTRRTSLTSTVRFSNTRLDGEFPVSAFGPPFSSLAIRLAHWLHQLSYQACLARQNEIIFGFYYLMTPGSLWTKNIAFSEPACNFSLDLPVLAFLHEPGRAAVDCSDPFHCSCLRIRVLAQLTLFWWPVLVHLLRLFQRH